mmetsp:Transcript_21573/g.31371  ORF Transcript_21573/g.31371 Transcript_21573/m.31371 type:complete len:692 (+) Transcript_21573:209-2284(+)|eukprot:CAMPEP_0185028978 /NCGR_PEP_ID=MMETSP1103-20130426/15078_1 /TAXON_ID=36769 /ORGANISM="Paraphysomonas bandaiensis, Strain Caron Lab Isolate" /LENGTH=691 /DNA_ID=CAMNT_0027563577 /DNA_START=116 /DNA_END=2191 /DNA_ORIENTATION=-
MTLVKWFALLWACCGSLCAARALYDLDLGGKLTDKVLTYSYLSDPVGIATGEYMGNSGIFVSSFLSHSIYFISISNSGHTADVVDPVKISGGEISVDRDGDVADASYAEPSRMVYDYSCNVLFVATRRAMSVRAVNFAFNEVTSLSDEDGEVISFGHPTQISEFPGMDVQAVDGDSLFVTNSRTLYRVSAPEGIPDEGYCTNILESPLVVEYASLSTYMSMNGYSEDAYVYSAAPDQSRSCVYVAISSHKNVILKVPFEYSESDDYIHVSRVAGDEGATWLGDTSLQQPPVSINGYAQSSSVKLAFPMHMQYDNTNQYLYWSECYPYAGEFLLGSLAVRRLSLITGEVDFYAGVDFTKDTKTYSYVGTEGGYVDGEVNVAEFRYPISIALSREEDNLGVPSGVLYVADRENDAIRRISNVVGTASPSSSFTPTSTPSISLPPTHRPTAHPTTSRPTISHQPTSTYSPSHVPTPLPTISIAPTFNPTKHPSRRPTLQPTRRPTNRPTKVKVVVEDVSLFHSMGLGSYHVTVGALVLSTFVGLFFAGVIVVSYMWRNSNSHMRLRTSDSVDSSRHDSASGGVEGSVNGIISRLLWGTAQYADNVDNGLEVSVVRTHSGDYEETDSSFDRQRGHSSIYSSVQEISGSYFSNSTFRGGSTETSDHRDHITSISETGQSRSSPMVVRSLGEGSDGL